MKNLPRVILSTGLIASMSFSASANLITNGSFEQGNTLNGSGWKVYQSLGGTTNDWTTVSGTGIEIQANGTVIFP
jgi:succinate dehydrogenase/fumarate reductase flavoprotein subunit